MQFPMSEFLEEQTKGLAELADNLRKSRIAAARKAAMESAARIKSLNERVRALARSGVRLTSISQGAAQSLIELQADIVTAALSDAAAQMERVAYTENVRDLARVQGEVLQATRQRIVEDISRTMVILKAAAGDVRKGAAPAAARAPARPKKVARRAAATRTEARPRAKPGAKAKVAARPRRKTARR
jgi:hypothetical protein